MQLRGCMTGRFSRSMERNLRMVWMRIGRPGVRSSAAAAAKVPKTAPAAKAVGAAMLAGLCVLALVGSARAGGFHVYSCRMPNGEAAPTDGWSGSATGVAVVAEDKC